MENLWYMVGYFLGSGGAMAIGITIGIVVLVLILPWLLNSIAVFKLAKEAGYSHPGFAFIPVGAIKQMVFCNSLGLISGEGPSATVVAIVAILTCGFLTGVIPVVGWILAGLAGIFYFVMFIFMLIHIIKFTSANGRGWVGAVLCWLFIPIFGFMIMCNMMRKQL